ncbi:MAG: hypothetical protein Q9218_002704 [Villophora microphyllina]
MSFSPTGTQLINLSIAVGVIDTVAVGLRLLARWKIKAPFAIDDYFIVGSLVPLYGMIASSTLLVERGGLGQPAASLAPGKIETFLKQLLMTTLVTYSLTITSVKMSLLLLYRRIFSTPVFKTWTLVIGATCAVWLIVAVLVDIFQCRPFNAAFQPDLLYTGHCINLPAFYIGIIAANFILDIVILALPLTMIWRLKLSERQKLQVSAIFFLGGLGCFAGIMRIVSIAVSFGDPQHDDVTISMASEYAWSQTEPALAIICACLITYRPLFRKSEKKVSITSFSQRSQPPSDWTDMGNTSRSRLRFPVANDFNPQSDVEKPLGNSTCAGEPLEPEFCGPFDRTFTGSVKFCVANPYVLQMAEVSTGLEKYPTAEVLSSDGKHPIALYVKSSEELLSTGIGLTPEEIHQIMIKTGASRVYGPLNIWVPQCACEPCEDQYVSVKNQTQGRPEFLYYCPITDAAAATLARQLRENIFDNLDLTRSQMDQRGNLIQERWLRKSNTKRRTFLKRLRPTMIESENAVMDIIYSLAESAMSTREHRESLLLPYLNVDTLARDGLRLLRLLHYRTSHHPEVWAHYDSSQLQAGWSHGSFAERGIPGCITMHGKSYGEWKPFDKAAVHNGSCYGGPRAILVLEAQVLLSQFLHDVVIALSSDTEAQTQSGMVEVPGNKISLRRKEPLIMQDARESQAQISYYSDPFSSPPTFDDCTIDQLTEIVSDKKTEAQDTLWLLQTDPAYFHAVAFLTAERDIGDFPGAQMPKTSRGHPLASRVTFWPIVQVLEWQRLEKELLNVRREYHAHSKDIEPGQPLPRLYGLALGALWINVMSDLSRRACHLRELVTGAPAWKHMYEAVPEESNRTETLLRRKDEFEITLAECYKSDRIYFCLIMLLERPDSLGFGYVPLLLRSLDTYLADCKKSEARKIDHIMYARITDMAALYRIITVLRLHKPWMTDDFLNVQDIMKYRETGMWKMQDQLLELTAIMKDPKKFRHGNPFDNLDRRALFKVWSSCKISLKRIFLSAGLDSLFEEYFREALSSYDAPEIQATRLQERAEILARLVQANLPRTPSSSEPYTTSIPHARIERRTPSKVRKPSSTLKVKSRSIEASSSTWQQHSDSAAAQGLAGTQESTLPLLPLPKKIRSLDTLRLLFPTATTDLQGGIQWTDFVATMAELGCSVEHRGGSEWTFRSISQDVSDTEGSVCKKQSIVIHQPHPDPKLPAVRLQWIGKRLWRRFGWARERFEGL